MSSSDKLHELETLTLAQLSPLIYNYNTNVLNIYEKIEKKIKYYEIILHETIFFHESGGQPYDIGLIDNISIISVYKLPSGEIAHKTLDSSALLIKNKNVTLSIDINRRMDHMQQHSSQHLISAIAYNLYGWNTLAWWLSTNPESCYIDFDTKEITDEQLKNLQNKITETIKDNKSVKTHIYESTNDYTKNAADRTLVYSGRKLEIPTETIDSKPVCIRVIEIDGIDFNKCCGTHVESISQLMLVRIMKTEKFKSNTRLYFLGGQRALNYFDQAIIMIKGLGELLHTSSDQFVSSVLRITTQLRETNKELEIANDELTKVLVKQYISDHTDSLLFWMYRADASSAFLHSLLDHLDTFHPTYVIGMVLSDDCLEIRVNDKLNPKFELAADQTKSILEILGAKGGGKGGKLQGKRKEGKWTKNQREEVEAIVKSIIASRN